MKTIDIFVGTVFGTSLRVAEAVKKQLESRGLATKLHQPGSVDDFRNAESILLITSSTGMGDIPAGLAEVYTRLHDEFPLLTEAEFAVIALGDSSYFDSYCGAGIKFYELLEELTAKPIAEILKIDACEHAEAEIPALEAVKLWY